MSSHSFNIDDFIIDKTLGIGSSGTVKLGFHRKTGKQYAIKEIMYNPNQDFDENQRHFMKEISTLKKMNHCTILKLRHFSLPQKIAPGYIVTDYMENGSLDTILQSERENNAPQWWNDTCKAKLLLRIACALMYVHERKGCHRDIKPANVLLDENHNAYLADFGISTLDIINTTQSCAQGTPAYMAPELFTDAVYDEKIDIFSFAMLLYEMASKKRLYKDLKNKYQICTFLSAGRRLSLNAIPKSFHNIISQCWAQDPSQRPSAREVVTYLINEKLFDKINQDEFQNEILKTIGPSLPPEPEESEYFIQHSQDNNPEEEVHTSFYTYSGDEEPSKVKLVFRPSTSYHYTRNELDKNSSRYDSRESSVKSYLSSYRFTKEDLGKAKKVTKSALSSPYRFTKSDLTSHSDSSQINSENNFQSSKPDSLGQNVQELMKLGYCHLKGYNGLTKNYNTAFQYFEKAYQQGNSEAALLCSKISFSNKWYAKGVDYLKKACSYNDVEARVIFGEMKCSGEMQKEGINQNVNDGILILKDVVNDVTVSEQFLLIGHRFYQVGFDLNNDDLKRDARKAFKKAAKLNNPDGIYNYGIMKELGIGGNPKVIKSISIYGRAAQMNHIPSLLHLGTIYESGKNMPYPDIKTAMSYYKKAKSLGCQSADEGIIRINRKTKYNLGNLITYDLCDSVRLSNLLFI